MKDETISQSGRRRGSGRTALLTVLLAMQVLCAVFFVGDVFEDIRLGGVTPHSLFESAVAVVLFVGVVLGGREMRRTIERNRRAEDAATAASGAFATLIKGRFDAWHLTAAESEVAMLALKGFDVAEMSSIRGTAEGTVRAQLTRIYAKAGATSRPQFVSLFIDDLLAAPIIAGKVGGGEG
tara:strand:+ start:1390 stop:1932 length:543 start_codon:yes stop_codon:yes gene_type:complete